MDNSGPYNHVYGAYPYDRYSPPPVYPPPPNQPYPPSNPSPYAFFHNQPYPPPPPAGYTSHFSPVNYGYPVQDPFLPILPSHDNNNNTSSSSHSDQYTSPSSAPVLHHQSGFHRLSSKPRHSHSQSLSESDSNTTLNLTNFRYNPVDSASTTSERNWEDGDNNANGLVPIYPPVYPPIDNLNNLHLLENSQPRAESSSSLPSAAAKASSSATLRHSFGTKYDKKYDTPERIDGGGNRLSLSSWESANSGPISSPFVRPVLSHSVSFPHSGYGQNLKIVPVGQNSSGALLLHGNLDIWVFGARNLPNMDMFHKTIGDVFQKLPGNVSNRIEGTMSHKITSDPYVSITIGGAVIGRTFVISNSENPLWQQHFCVPVAHNASVVQFFVKDSDIVGSQLIGIVSISVEKIVSGAKIHGFYPILNTNKKLCKAGASLNLSMKYTPSKQVKMYHLGVGPGPDYFGVPDTYFPLRKGGKLTLYQDAHVPNGCLPVVSLDNGTDYVHGKCWYDIFSAISQARRLIYITGWSVWHKVRLIRDGGTASRYSLGDLLRMRSQEGVRVLLLIWDDPTSRSILGYKTDGVMQTHDEETRRFFKHSSVQVILCPRMAGKRHSWVKQKEVGTIYTHHQKTVVVDADAGNNTRRIVAFIGGLDLCDGRYDTPRHPIFSTLQTVHRDDYHNPTYTGSAVGCPREPWHDLHCKIDGPAAYDVLTNFEQRWLNASTAHGIKKLKKSDDALLRIDRLPDIMGQSDAPCLGEDDPESWHVQIFRSIDSNSVKGFPKDPKDGTSQNLVCGKNVLIDMSIHAAYVKAIRSAQRFIYIENQYFLGSSYNWSSNKELGANNLIPMEIALKIAEKIRANQRFATYIVIPMWPEGNPTGAATQRILFWQHKTMQMMYEIIYKALVEVGLESAHHPLDYLNFFCLGNREAANFSSVPIIDHSNTTNSPQALTQKNRRFMIYVHSKGMIVDDEYVIIGSANINQRSLEGTRDTEIAMGAYQPHHTSAREPPSPLGQVYGYRMSLMAEHLGMVEDCFIEPESLKCVHRVRQLSEMNWEQFSGEKIMPMSGHLMKYPVEVDRCGRVTPLPGHENFPDVGGKIIGSFLAIQENLTI